MLTQPLLLGLASFFTRLAVAQESSSTGPESFGGGDLPAMEWDGPRPYICSEGCYTPSNVYYFCFLNTTLWDGRQADQNECNNYLCQRENYDLLAACLNCIVANGNERSISATATDNSNGPAFEPVGGYINLEKANGWLANVTERCQGAGSAFNGDVTTTVTASPTTTGPYYTSWSSGQTRGFPTWTGLTQYADQFFPSVTPVFGAVETDSSGSTMSASSGMSTSSAPPSASSASAQATSPANSGTLQATSSGMLWLVSVFGLFGLL